MATSPTPLPPLQVYSDPRQRASIYVLGTRLPKWREMRIHESSPGAPVSRQTPARVCRLPAYELLPRRLSGESIRRLRSEDPQKQTLPDASFDLVVTYNVFEHILNSAAFRGDRQTPKPRGAHFTLSWYWWKPALVRAVAECDGI